MKNPAASIRARLLNLSRESGEPLDGRETVRFSVSVSVCRFQC